MEREEIKRIQKELINNRNMRNSSFKSSNSSKGFLGLGMFALLVWLYGITAWIVNLVILLNCDFEGPWKDEIIHGIGLLGPCAMFTVWF